MHSDLLIYFISYQSRTRKTTIHSPDFPGTQTPWVAVSTPPGQSTWAQQWLNQHHGGSTPWVNSMTLYNDESFSYPPPGNQPSGQQPTNQTNGYQPNGYQPNGYPSNGYQPSSYQQNGYPQHTHPQNAQQMFESGYPQSVHTGYQSNTQPQYPGSVHGGYNQNGYPEYPPAYQQGTPSGYHHTG